jgi:hypothetical protein
VSEQPSGTVEEARGANSLAHGAAHELQHNSGSPKSWVAVAVIVVGFIVGGVALVPHPTWWAFWLGVGIAVVGCLMTAFAKTFTDDWY